MQKFDVTEHIRGKVREVLIGSIPDEQMDAMVRAEVERFFEGERVSGSSARSAPPFRAMVEAEIKAQMAETFKAHVRQYMQSYWTAHGEAALTDFTAQVMGRAQEEMMKNLVAHALQSMGSSLGFYINVQRS
jgi:hypothetical protein